MRQCVLVVHTHCLMNSFAAMTGNRSILCFGFVFHQEFSLEKTLDKMQADWAGIHFDSMPWRSSGSSILRGVDDIQQLLDDQVVKTQAMRASPYIGPFEEGVKTWEAKLNQTQVGSMTAETRTALGIVRLTLPSVDLESRLLSPCCVSRVGTL